VALGHVGQLVVPLREQGVRIAVGNLGAAYAGLSMFAQIEPDFINLDHELARDVRHSATKRRLISSVVRLCGDLNVVVIAVGVSSEADADALVELGVNLLQGPLFT